MVNPDNREIMAQLYRIMEKYEKTPVVSYSDEAVRYFEGVRDDIMAILSAHAGNEFARELTLGLYNALDSRFRSHNKMPLADRPDDGEQLHF